MKKWKTPSRTSPKGTKRACLCDDGKTYSRKCCDGSLQAQGIGNITYFEDLGCLLGNKS